MYNNFKSYNTTTGDLNWSIIYQFTKLRGFQTKSSIIAEEVYLKIWRLLTQILTWHMPSVGTRGGCFPWPMIALVRYCWLGRDIVNSTPGTTIDNGQRWRSSRQNSHGHRERVCATLVADNVKAARPWKWSKSTLSQLSHPTLDSPAKDNVNLHFVNPYSNWLQCSTYTLHTEQLGSFIYIT